MGDTYAFIIYKYAHISDDARERIEETPFINDTCSGFNDSKCAFIPPPMPRPVILQVDALKGA